jgi:hypothetical protein
MSLLPSTIPIYCLSIKRFPDKRLYFYSYYDHLDILLYSAFRLSWHLAADYPIEMYKGNTFAINEFYKLDKTEQYIINSLLHMRYGQDFNTRLIEHLEIKDIKPIPAALFKFPHAHIWKVIAYFNSLVRHERYVTK